MKKLTLWGAVALTVVSLTACNKVPQATDDNSNGIGSEQQFKILAGSELKDFGDQMTAAAKQEGIDVKFTYAGTLDTVDRINTSAASKSDQFDAILPPNSAYPSLALTRKPVATEKLFYSRIAMGVRQAKLQELGWDKKNPSWSDIAQAVKQGKLSYAMTNPTSSNSGMSALFAVAASGAGKTEDVSSNEVNTKLLETFLKGQHLTAGSSGWLADAFVKSGQNLDGMINYEAVLLRANEKLNGANKLAIIYPTDGVITANYPLMLLNAAKKPDFDKLVATWKSEAFQKKATHFMYLRPAVSTVPADPALSASQVIDLSFPNKLDVIDKVLSAYQSELRRPATSIFVLDVSGSMREDHRIEDVQNALKVLTGSDQSTATVRYARFQNREHVILMAFDDQVHNAVTVNFDGNLNQARAHVNEYADSLNPDGGTAIYGALLQAEQMAKDERAAHPDRLVSIVLLTDGENTNAPNANEFARVLGQMSGVNSAAAIAGAAPARIFPIIFGDASDRELSQVAGITGGKLFDGRRAPLPSVFKEIRGYQ